MKSKLIRELHSIGIYRHPINRKKLETIKTSEIIKIWYEYYNNPEEVVIEGELATEQI